MTVYYVLGAVPSDSWNKVTEIVQELIVKYSMKTVAAVAILLIGLWVAKQIKKLLVQIMHRSKMDETLISFVASLLFLQKEKGNTFTEVAFGSLI